MINARLILAALCAAPLLSGCLLVDVGVGAVKTTGAVVGGAVDLVTTSDEEQMRKDNKTLKKENDELKRQNKDQRD